MKRLLIVMICLIMAISNMTQVAATLSGPNLYSNYAIALDTQTGMVLTQKKAHGKMYPASITKIVTVAVSLPLIENLDDTVTITAEDLETIYETGASSANFTVGETVTYRDLVLGALIPSGADACRALGFNLFGSQEAIVAKMNELAASLSLTDTHFTNTTGIHDDNHYSSAYDMAILLSYASSLDGFEDLFAQNKATSSNGLHTWYKRVVYNANNAGIDTSSLIGCKSGYTSQASHTLASLTTANNHKIAVVVANAEKTDTQHSPTMADTMTLTDFVAGNFSDISVVAPNSQLTTAPVVDGTSGEVALLAKDGAVAFLPENYQEKLKLEYQVDTLEAPLVPEQTAGKVTISYDGVKLQEIDLVIRDSVARDHISYFLHHPLELVFPYLSGILLAGVFVSLGVVSHKIKKKRK
ncbi:MAG: serine hydrolase [Erysipelotrichaceae bacterium]|nr:serine hydrolase [Erysipelotrichaceae bacterium]